MQLQFYSKLKINQNKQNLITSTYTTFKMTQTNILRLIKLRIKNSSLKNCLNFKTIINKKLKSLKKIMFNLFVIHFEQQFQ